MTYSEKVKAAQIIIEKVKALNNFDTLTVEYGKDYNNEPVRYKFRVTEWKSGKSFSIYKDDVIGLDGMNIDSFTKTQAKAYTYDMMKQRTNYNFPLYEMKIVSE